MADRVVPVDVRLAIIEWADGAPRGAVSRFCRTEGISRSQFYEIRARARLEGPVAAMEPRPRPVPVRHRQAVALEVEELAVQIRKELKDAGWDAGPLTVRHKLLDLGIQAPAVSTLARIFTSRGMVTAQPQKRPKTRWKRFEAATVHECWQLDGFEWHLADGSRFCILQLIDDKSRFPIATRAALGERSEDAIAVVAAGIDRFQVPCRLLTDNGSAFNTDRRGHRTRLVTWLQSLGCRPVTGTPGHPQTQGKNERAHQSLQRWLRARDSPVDPVHAQALIDEYDATFALRRHQGLQMLTPAHVLTVGPVAIPPAPPQPAPAPPSGPSARQVKVAKNGNVDHMGITVHLDPEHANTVVTMIRAGAVVNVFDAKGHHLRTVHVKPGRRYYGNGKPRGPRPKPKCPD